MFAADGCRTGQPSPTTLNRFRRNANHGFCSCKWLNLAWNSCSSLPMYFYIFLLCGVQLPLREKDLFSFWHWEMTECFDNLSFRFTVCEQLTLRTRVNTWNKWNKHEAPSRQLATNLRYCYSARAEVSIHFVRGPHRYYKTVRGRSINSRSKIKNVKCCLIIKENGEIASLISA